MQGNGSTRRTAVGSGVVTGLSPAAVSGSAAIAGAILARKFGHGVKTDGFFAAYGAYLALVLVAQTLRGVVLPPLTRARGRGRLADEAGGWAVALGAVAVPAVVVAVAAPGA